MAATSIRAFKVNLYALVTAVTDNAVAAPNPQKGQVHTKFVVRPS